MSVLKYFGCLWGTDNVLSLFVLVAPKEIPVPNYDVRSGLVTGVSYDYYRYHALPIARRYALVISEIDWRKRLEVIIILFLPVLCSELTHTETCFTRQWDNHHEFFPRRGTIIIDTLPIRVCIPNDRLIARLLFQPK